MSRRLECGPAASFVVNLCFLFAILGPVQGAVTDIFIERSIESDISLSTFAFNNHGHFELNISHLLIYSPERNGEPDTSQIGFFLSNGNLPVDDVRNTSGHNLCHLHQANVTNLFVLNVTAAAGGGEHPPYSFQLDLPGPGEKTLFFSICAPNRIVSAEVHVVQYNQAPAGSKHYLSAGQGLFPYISAALGVLYLVVLSVWLVHASRVWCTTPLVPQTFHIAISALLVADMLVAFSLSLKYTTLQAAGSSSSWSTITNVLYCLQGITLLTTVSTALLQIEPYISDLERGVLFLAVPVLVVANVAQALLGEAPRSTLWRHCVLLIRAVFNTLTYVSWSLVGILLAIAVLSWASTQSWAAKPRHGPGRRDDRDVENVFSRLSVVGTTYIAALCVVTSQLRATLPYWMAWLPLILQELGVLLLVCFVLHKFRPRTEKSVYELFDETDSVEGELDAL